MNKKWRNLQAQMKVMEAKTVKLMMKFKTLG